MATDLEMTKLCAEAMGFSHNEWSHATPHQSASCIPAYACEDDSPFEFDPLQDDAQAMALVKRFSLLVHETGIEIAGYRGLWLAAPHRGEGDTCRNPDLNRAVVECVAKMQSAISKDAAASVDCTDSLEPDEAPGT